MLRKSINGWLHMVLLVLLLMVPYQNVYATQSHTENFDKSYSLGSNQAENLVNVAQKQLGKNKANLGYTEAWCADFVCDCAKLTGMADNIIPYNYASRGACTYLYNYMVKNCSAAPVSSRQKGDIIFYYCSGCGRYVHTGIVLDATYTIEGNYDGKVTQVKNSYTDSAGHKLSQGTITRKYLRPNYTSDSNPSYKNFSISKNEYKLKEKIEFFITPINTTGIGISIDKEGVGRVVAAGCNRANGHDIWASDLGVGNYSAHITVYNGNKWVDTETVWFSIVDPQPSYSNFSVSQSVYNLHDKIQFKIDPINATGIGISIDKEGVGRVVAEDCNEANGHSLWGINLGVGNYSAHITVYNDEKWIDTNTVYFSVVPPGYSNLEINKQKVGTAEDMKFKINTSHAEFMVLKIENEKGEERYVERCWDSLDSWSVKADKLGVGNYKAYFLVFSTNDYYIETEKIPFTVYQSPERSKLTCLPGNSYSKTIFQWEESAYTDYYDLRIDAADYEKGGNIKNVWQLRGNRCSVWLPAGEYAAHVDSVNKDGAVGGELIYFTVKEGKAGTPVNLGSEVRARIITSSGRPIMNDEKKVKLDSEKKENLNQIWKFIQQSDNSYVIYSEMGNGVLTAQNSVGSSVYIDQYQNLDSQKWNLYGNSEDGYVIKSVGTGYVLGLSGEDSVFGNYVLKYSDDQMFEIEKTSEIKIDTPVVSVENLDGETNGNIKVKWNTCDNATNYDLLLYDADSKELKNKISDIEGTSYILKLAVGNYYVCIQAKNKQTGGKTTSEQVEFAVKENISTCNMILEKNVFEYDGTEKKPQVRVYNTQGNLLQSSEYSVAYENNLNAGTATVRITGKNAYLGTKTIDFVINKASQKLRSSMDGKRVPDGEKVNLGITGIGKISYQVEQKDIAEVDANGMVTAKTAGNVNVLVTAEGDKNHNQAQVTVRFIFEHQYDDGVITTAASCEVDGERTYTCAGCKANYTEKIKATGHSWDSGKITKNATCKEPGSKTYTCIKCRMTSTEEIPVTGHQHTELRNVKVATCAKEGYTGDTYCKDCNTKLSSGETIAKKSHTWDEGKVTTKATCAQKGIKTYTCTVCNETKTEEIPATGKHVNTELRNAREATCMKEGYTGDTYCKDCNTKLSSGETIAKKSHTWDEGKVTTKATCVQKGIKTYTCTVCNETKTEEIPATGKHENTELRNVKEATCAEEGYTGDTYCKDCNTKLASGEAIAKKAHTWDKGKITTKATCTEKGIKTYTCTVCNITKTAEIPATGHQHTELRNTKEATCAQEGYTGDTYCTDCGTKISSGKSIPKADHAWDEGKVTQNATCTEKGIRTFTCTVCESTRIEEIPATGHANKIMKFAKEASCKSDGYSGDIFCQDCGKLLEEGVVIRKKEHTWNKGKITTQATCTTGGIKTYTCTSCGTTKTEAIGATGHGKTVIRNKKNASVTSEGYTGDIYCTICNQKISSGKRIAKLTPQTATPGKTVNDKSTNGVYKVLKDGRSVEFTKPVSKKASVRIPDTIKVNGITCKVTGISANAFKNNKSLKSVTIGKNVTVIGTNAFYGCRNLSRVSGGNAIVKISDKAFANCSSLTGITFSVTVRSIGKQAFYNCKNFRTIIIKTDTLSGRTIGTKAFTGTYKKPVVKVPAKQLNIYKKLLSSKGMSTRAVYKKS